MSRHWEENRTDGRLCLIIDPEDGTQPQRVYGKDKDEILEKVTRTAEHAARWIAPQKQNNAGPLPKAPSADRAPAARKPMTADQQMQATNDLSNPAKAPQAVRALLDEATGGGLAELEELRKEKRERLAAQHFAGLAMAFESRHPEFYRSPGNQKLMVDTVAMRAGLANATEETLEAVYAELVDGGYLQDIPAGQPNETSAQPRPAREREATSYRKNGLRATTPPTTSTQPKYTRAQVDALPADKMLEKYNTDPEFRRAVDLYSQPRSATA